jgi:hypothetical protein
VPQIAFAARRFERDLGQQGRPRRIVRDKANCLKSVLLFCARYTIRE